MSDERPGGRPSTIDRRELEKSIERQIVLGTWGRIHNLTVQVSDDAILIRGRAPSHYIKQLVLHATYSVIGFDCSMRVDFDIHVRKITQQILPGDNDLWGVPQIGGE